jgi:hypothetical protein
MLRNMADGARLALMVGVTLMIVNGVWARVNPSSQTLTEWLSGKTAGLNMGGTA